MNDLAALFRRLSMGVYVIGAAHAGQRNAFTASWVMQVSFDPLLLALSINAGHASFPLVREGEGFAVSVLGQGQLGLARHFGTQSGREVDKLAGIPWRPGRHGAPVLMEAIAFFECERTDCLRAGDHELVLGRVVDGRLSLPDAEPLSYIDTGDMDGSGGLYPESFQTLE